MLLLQVPVYIFGIGRSMFPGIVATPQGISLSSGWLQRGRQIPWHLIRAWGIERPTTPKGQTTYAIFWSGRTITWFEPAHPRPVYHTMMERMHALIAARTGLPPHQIEPHP